MTPVTIAYGNLLSPALGEGGIDPTRLDGDLQERFERAQDGFESLRTEGSLGFLDLPGDDEARSTVQEVADSFGQWFETVVVVGIGGSSLGGRALADALLGLHWNLGSNEDREHFPRLFFLENTDPDSFTDLLSRLDPRRTLFNIVSKSGSTAETLAQFLAIEELLAEVLDADQVPGHFLFTTDPSQGALRRMAEARGIPTLSIPPSVGGRFSVLSPVGLLPGAVTGIDVSELLAGAAAMATRCRTRVLRRNPAGLLAVLLHLSHVENGRPIHVLMPYGDRLRTLAQWFQQLWAESLGKRVGGGEGTGPTPLAALGAVDQHSLLQLFMDGPADKVIVFLRSRSAGAEVPIPRRHPEEPALAYLGGHGLGALLEVERRATAEALRRAGRPSLTLEIERVDARSLGALFMLFQIATVHAAALYGVNPLDQPGVELGKELTYGLLGREGYEAPGLEDEDAGGARV